MRTAAPIRSILLALLTVFLSAAASAQQQSFQLDPARSRVEFTLGATLHTVHGSFRLKTGSIQFDPTTGDADGKLVVDATSGDTGNNGRDRKMHREILESGRFPEITFAPQHITGLSAPHGASPIEIRGVMTLHGQQHPMTISLSVLDNGNEASGDASFVIPYIAWGLKNPSTLLLRVSDKVNVTIHAVGRLSR